MLCEGGFRAARRGDSNFFGLPASALILLSSLSLLALPTSEYSNILYSNNGCVQCGRVGRGGRRKARSDLRGLPPRLRGFL